MRKGVVGAVYQAGSFRIRVTGIGEDGVIHTESSPPGRMLRDFASMKEVERFLAELGESQRTGESNDHR